jgi:hypothetical protein
VCVCVFLLFRKEILTLNKVKGIFLGKKKKEHKSEKDRKERKRESEKKKTKKNKREIEREQEGTKDDYIMRSDFEF